MGMARPVWTGSISFGLVNVPVKAYTAVRDHDIHFNQLEKKSGSRIRNRKVSEKSGKEVDADDIEMGFEIRKGRYVTFDKKELEELRPASTRMIEVSDFVALDEIDPIYYERTYWLGSGRRRRQEGLRPAAVRDGGARRVAIGTVVMRNKQYLTAVRPLDGVLAMSTMRFADEIVPRADVDGLPEPAGQARRRALKMATQLVDSLASDWDPATLPRHVCRRVAQAHQGARQGQGDRREGRTGIRGQGARPDGGARAQCRSGQGTQDRAARSTRSRPPRSGPARPARARSDRVRWRRRRSRRRRSRPRRSRRRRRRPRRRRRAKKATPKKAARAGSTRIAPNADFTVTSEPAGLRGAGRRRASVRRAAAPCPTAPLRPETRGRRRVDELGRAERPDARSRREAHGGPRRGPSARVLRLRGRHPGRRVRRRRRHRVGLGHMGASRRRAIRWPRSRRATSTSTSTARS